MHLLRAINNQFILMIHKKNFKFVFSIMMLYSSGTYLVEVYMSRGADLSTLYSADSYFIGSSFGNYFQYFASIFPFIVVFPFSFSYLNDKSVSVIPFLVTRMGSTYYFSAKIIVAFIGGFLIICIPFLINIGLLSITFPHNYNTHFGFYNSIQYSWDLLGSNVTVSTVGRGLPFLKLYVLNPNLYNVLYTLLLSAFTGLMSIFALACSYWITRYKVIAFLPTYLLFFICNTADNFLFYSNTYLNTNLLDYVTVDTTMGKHVLFIITVCLAILIFSLYRTWKVSQADQI